MTLGEATTCFVCTGRFDVPVRLSVICERCLRPLCIVSERDPIVTDDGRVWVGIKTCYAWRRVRDDAYVADDGRSWRGVESVVVYRGVPIEELPTERQAAVLSRLGNSPLFAVKHDLPA
jgi:hypothetical protein